MREKIHSYLGFARKSGNLLSGQETCAQAMKKRKLRLLLMTEDLSENTRKKLIAEAERQSVPYRVYGHSDDLSAAAGARGNAVFGIIDENFSNVIIKEIDKNQSEKEVWR